MIKVKGEQTSTSTIPTGEKEATTQATETETPSDKVPSGEEYEEKLPENEVEGKPLKVEQGETPGFEAIFSFTGLLAVAYLVRKRLE